MKEICQRQVKWVAQESGRVTLMMAAVSGEKQRWTQESALCEGVACAKTFIKTAEDYRLAPCKYCCWGQQPAAGFRNGTVIARFAGKRPAEKDAFNRGPSLRSQSARTVRRGFCSMRLRIYAARLRQHRPCAPPQNNFADHRSKASCLPTRIWIIHSGCFLCAKGKAFLFTPALKCNGP